MTLQSKAPAILLTRPLAQSQRFARSLRAGFAGPLCITISPLMKVAFLAPVLPLPRPDGLIFSSETGVMAYARLPDRPMAPVWCIGQRTGKAAINAGLETAFCAINAADLLIRMRALHPEGHFLHLRGEDSRGEIAENLTAFGIPTAEATVYAQRPALLASRALRLLQGTASVIVPLFSARSAQLFCEASPTHAPIRFAALSAAVAAAIPPDRARFVVISQTPDGKAMRETVISLLREPALG